MPRSCRIPCFASTDRRESGKVKGSKGTNDLAKPNYQYEKRQRELAKKAKKAEKAARKSTDKPDDDSPELSVDGLTPGEGAGESGASPATEPTA